MKIILLESYFGGSHRLWAEQLQKYGNFNLQIISLPARHWKWRMEGAAIHFVENLQNLSEIPDLLITTSMTDLSFIKAQLDPSWSDVPLLYYMHESQLSYPKSADDKDQALNRDHHYTMIHFRSMLCANVICFNSAYHQTKMYDELGQLLKRLPDYNLQHLIPSLKSKSKVLHIGVEETRLKEKEVNPIPILMWNHRWEYDKNPKDFFDAMMTLKKEGIAFQLIVSGSKGKKYPEIFDVAKNELKEQIIHWGYAESRAEYLGLLYKADFLPVTSIQEFFGISLIEATLAGVIPILPKRLVYPEHFDPKEYNMLYYDTQDQFVHILKSLCDNKDLNFLRKSLRSLAKQYLWSEQIGIYDQYFKSLIH